MKAVVFRGIGDIRLEDVPEPRIQDPQDAIVRITTCAICGTDLHLVRGTVGGMKPGTILGHEGVGIVEQVGPDVRNLKPGDRVVIPSSIACGYCAYCREGYYSQCDVANPNGNRAGTAYFGGPQESGSFNGMQAELVRVPFATVGPVKVPDDVPDEHAILLSDIFPTAYFGADLADIEPGHSVAVFGCGAVGQLAILSAFIQGAGRVFAVDCIESRLQVAQQFGAETINYEKEHPVETILRLTGGIGVDRAIDAVGVDANMPHSGPAASEARQHLQEFQMTQHQVVPQAHPSNGNWHPGDAPPQAFLWACQSLAKAGTLSIVGVYPPNLQYFPIGEAMNRNFTVRMGNCPHRRYIPTLLDVVRSGAIDLTPMLTQELPFGQVIDAFKQFDRREPGWIKVALETDRQATPRAAATAGAGR